MAMESFGFLLGKILRYAKMDVIYLYNEEA